MRDQETVVRLLDRIRELGPLLRDHMAEMETACHLPMPAFAALAEAGLFRLWLPAALGGLELSPLDFMSVVEAAAAVDGSVGWIVGDGAGASRFAGYLPTDAARHWFAAPGAFLVTATGAVGRAVPTEGGYRVSGRWPFGSGIHGASGVAGVCAIAQDGPPRTLICIAPASAAAVVDTWRVAGLRGTGSDDWTLDDVFVPAAHCVAFPDHTPMQPGIVYQLPIGSAFVWSVAVVPLGIARGALDAFIALAGDRVRLGTSQPLREREAIQAEVGRAEARIRAGRALLRTAMQELMDATARGVCDLLPARAAVRLAASHAAEAALEVAAALERMAGTAAIFEAGPLARRLRDVRTAVQHVAMTPQTFAVVGRLALGLDAGTARI